MRELAASYVPAADEVGRLQRGKDVESRLFQQIAEQGHFAGRTVPSDTRQGIYATAPSGVLLASINTRDARAMAAMLRRGLARWEELAPEERFGAPPEGRPNWRWEARYPEDGLALRVITRDIERPNAPDDWRARAWNQDFAWFTRAEAQTLVPLEPTVPGSALAWPPSLVERLVRFHLVDSVRGQVTSFAAQDVEHAELKSTVTAVEGSLVTLELHGATRTAVRGRWDVNGFRDQDAATERTRGFEAELLGRAHFDREHGRFTSFELIAVGTRWGGTQFNGRGDDLEPAPIGVSLTLAGDTPAERVAPAYVWAYGW